MGGASFQYQHANNFDFDKFYKNFQESNFLLPFLIIFIPLAFYHKKSQKIFAVINYHYH